MQEDPELQRTEQTGRNGCDSMPAATASADFAILGSVPVGVLVLRKDATLAYANAAARALFECEEAGVCLSDTLCPADGSDIEDHLQDGRQFEAIVAGAHSHRHVMVSVAERASGEASDFVVSMTDITALKRATERAEFLAHHDPLTTLGNRTLLRAVWDDVEERMRAEGLAVHALALDLDRFKEVNDVHGHGIGDLVLRQAADRIRLAVGDAGQAFRFGGDEFFALIVGTSQAEAVRIGRRIIESLRQPMTVMGLDLSIGCSVGIASGPHDGTLRDGLHRAADLALYEVKRAGRGDVACFDANQERALLDRRLIQAELVLALAEERLDLAFHPQFCSRSGALEGLEATVGWSSARAGRTVGPGELSELARETGLADLLDVWTLKNAVARFTARQAEGLPCPLLAVTIGASSLTRPEFIDILLRTLDEQGLSPDRLEVQIAETFVICADGALASAIRRLGDLGVRIVIDGFLSDKPDLSYLRSLGVKRLKFDRDVAERMLGDADTEPLFEAIWTLCQKLGIEMSANGVETERQWHALGRLGRLRAQGPLFEASAISAPLGGPVLGEACG